MKEHSANTANHIFSSFKRMMHKQETSKYLEKVIGSFNKHIKGDQHEGQVLFTNKYENFCIFNDDYSPEYDDVCEEEFGVQSVSSTNDSGIITHREDRPPTKPPTKKLQFSIENNTIIEVEVERDEPVFYNSTPKACVARICETPKLQKVEIRPVRNTPKFNAAKNQELKEDEIELLTEDVLKSANIIKDIEPPATEPVLEVSIQSKNFTRSPSCRSVDEKFVVNLFESRQSKRWKRKSIAVPNADEIQSFVDYCKEDVTKETPVVENRKNNCSEAQLDDAEDAMFQKLKTLRDIECVKMTQASNALKAIRKKPNKEWTEELLAEKILLETDEKYKLIVSKIRDLNYAEVKMQKLNHQGTVTLSNFQYNLKPQELKKSKYSEFYILCLSHGTDLLMSKIVTPSQDKVVFEDNFTIAKISSDFNIKAQVFSIKLKTSGRMNHTLLKKKTKNLCPMSRIFYENVHTYELEESTVLKPSFLPCAEVNITKDDIGSTSFIISKIPEGSRIRDTGKFSITVDDLEITTKLSGFLTLGLPNKQNNVLFWERKWCVLNGTQFSVFNYPSEEDFGQPDVTINLNYCFVPLARNLSCCSKKRSFLLKTGRPSRLNDTNNVTLRRRNNFVLEKYFLAADNNKDFTQWTETVESVLDCLRDWQKLVFVDDYY